MLLLASWGCSSPGDPGRDGAGEPDRPPAEESQAPTAKYAKDSVIVRFRSARTPSALRSALARVNGSITDRNADGIDDRFAHVAAGRLAAVHLGGGVSVDDALAALRADPDVLYAEPNYIVRASLAPNDPRFADLYGLDNTGQTGGTADADIDAVEAWDVSVGSAGIVVAVIDTGIDYTHEDLAANMWVNPGETAGNGRDDDGNGYIDDVHGIDALSGSGDPFDDHAHGTHCAGTIGAVGDNGVGVAGVNWQVQLMALKFLGADGFGTIAGAITAIDYAIAQRAAGVNLRVLSNSWGVGEFSQGLLDAILSSQEAGLLFVAAAGNGANSTDLFPHYPSGYDVPSIVSVAAMDHEDRFADISNFGAETVDLAAPGVDVVSTVPGGAYVPVSGTSMATPHVAGVAALILSFNDTLGTDELKDVLLTSGDPLPDLQGVTVSGRRLNAASALEQAGPPIPRFSLGVDPLNDLVTQGEAVAFTIDVGSLAGFAGEVALSVAVDPAIDATLTLPEVVAAPGSGTLTVATTEATARGVYQLTVTGRTGDLVQTRTVSLRVRAPGDPLFGVTASPSRSSVMQGQFTLLSINVESFGANSLAELAVTSDPPLPFAFDRPVVPIPGRTDLFAFAECDTPAGTYDLTISATSEGVTMTTTATVVVTRFGAATFSWGSGDTPLSIPDASPDGVTSEVHADAFEIAELRVDLDITHPSVGDLVVELISPDGTEVTLHDREAGEGGIHRIYTVPGFEGRNSEGTWRLRVSDHAGTEVGTLDRWSLLVLWVPTVFPPIADFVFSGQGRTFQFVDRSGGGSCTGEGAPIVQWLWEFGDGTVSTDENPIHVFPAPGDYDVFLSVVDANGRSAGAVETVTATRQPFLSILRITRDPSRLEFRVDLRWRDAAGALVELHRNGDLVDIPDNDGQMQDRFRRYTTSYTWRLCEQRSDLCSNEVSVDFGPDFESGEATVKLEQGGVETVHKLRIEDE